MSHNNFPLGCPCGYRPPSTDDIDSWNAWYDHLKEEHPEKPKSQRRQREWGRKGP